MIVLFLLLLTLTLPTEIRGEETGIPPEPRISTDALLEAIAAIEAWDGVTAGKAGEWGRWQMQPCVFRQYFPNHLLRRSSTEQQRIAAQRHAEWIRGAMARKGIDMTVYNFALVWGAGLYTVENHQEAFEKRDYAQRVMNTYYDKAKQ